MEQLKRGISDFKNGSFDQAITRLESLDLSKYSTKDQLLCREYLAAALERLGRHDEALPHARSMISLDPSSPKGYLRLGKLLRLLNDDSAASLAYSMGLKRAKTGLDKIREQIVKLQAAQKAKLADCYDPFYRLPLDVSLKTVEFAKLAGVDMQRLRKVSLDAAKTVMISSVGILDFRSQTATASKLRHLLELRTDFDRVTCSVDNFVALLKVASKLGVRLSMKKLILRGKLTAQYLPDKPILIKVNFLALFDATISSPLLDVLLNDSLTQLVIKNSHIFGSESLISLHQLKELLIKNIAGISPLRISDIVRNNIGLETLYWSDPDALLHLNDGLLRNHRKLSNLVLNASSLSQLSLMGLDPVQIRCLRFDGNHLVDIDPGSLGCLASFPKLNRLALCNIVFSKRQTWPQLNFPQLEHLLLNAVHEVPHISNWTMPRLKTCCIHMCELFHPLQIPKPSQELLIERSSLYLAPGQYQQIIQMFPRLKVLGISDAQKLYACDGINKLQALSRSNPLACLLINSEDICKRIQKIWPSME